jgi:hypothetical protein
MIESVMNKSVHTDGAQSRDRTPLGDVVVDDWMAPRLNRLCQPDSVSVRQPVLAAPATRGRSVSLTGA